MVSALEIREEVYVYEAWGSTENADSMWDDTAAALGRQLVRCWVSQEADLVDIECTNGGMEKFKGRWRQRRGIMRSW